MSKHPMQPLVNENGVIRFQENAILRYLVDAGIVNLNELARMRRFSNDDRMQLAQLIGYSVSGYGDLSYVSEESIAEADAAAEILLKKD